MKTVYNAWFCHSVDKREDGIHIPASIITACLEPEN